MNHSIALQASIVAIVPHRSAKHFGIDTQISNGKIFEEQTEAIQVPFQVIRTHS